MVLFLPADASFRRLTFNDFPQRNLPAPSPGTTATAAQTSVNVQIQPNVIHFRQAEFLRPPNFQMVEDPNVTVLLTSSQMFVASWVFSQSQTFQNDLLEHEQGHYEISMLNAKDIFVELSDINGRAFATANQGANALRDMQRRLVDVQPIHNKYDADTNHGLNRANQTAWNTALSAARITFTPPSLRTALRNARLFP